MSRIVCLGDSITFGYPYGPRISWTNYLVENTEHQVFNEGINGNTTTNMLRRFERCVLAHQPTHIVIMGGANDIVWRESHDRIVWNLECLIKMSIENGIKPILGLPTPFDEPEMEKRMARVRDWVLKYAKENQLAVIDFFHQFFDADGNLREEYLLDGAHPTIEGYRAMSEAINLAVFN